MVPQTVVAVIDDDAAFIDLVEELLKDEGYRVLVGRSGGKEAYELVRETQPNIVVLDVRLGTPDDGWLVVELLRLDPTTATIPIIICSADGQFLRQKQEQLRARNCDYLEKPFLLDELLEKIRQNLPERQRET